MDYTALRAIKELGIKVVLSAARVIFTKAVARVYDDKMVLSGAIFLKPRSRMTRVSMLPH